MDGRLGTLIAGPCPAHESFTGSPRHSWCPSASVGIAVRPVTFPHHTSYSHIYAHAQSSRRAIRTRGRGMIPFLSISNPLSSIPAYTVLPLAVSAPPDFPLAPPIPSRTARHSFSGCVAPLPLGPADRVAPSSLTIASEPATHRSEGGSRTVSLNVTSDVLLSPTACQDQCTAAPELCNGGSASLQLLRLCISARNSPTFAANSRDDPPSPRCPYERS